MNDKTLKNIINHAKALINYAELAIGWDNERYEN